jgi:hypothetical protein
MTSMTTNVSKFEYITKNDKKDKHRDMVMREVARGAEKHP